MIRRIAIGVVALVFLGLLGFSLLSWRAAIAPIERPNPAELHLRVSRQGRSSGRGGTLPVLLISDQADCRLLAGME